MHSRSQIWTCWNLPRWIFQCRSRTRHWGCSTFKWTSWTRSWTSEWFYIFYLVSLFSPPHKNKQQLLGGIPRQAIYIGPPCYQLFLSQPTTTKSYIKYWFCALKVQSQPHLYLITPTIHHYNYYGLDHPTLIKAIYFLFVIIVDGLVVGTGLLLAALLGWTWSGWWKCEGLEWGKWVGWVARSRWRRSLGWWQGKP